MSVLGDDFVLLGALLCLLLMLIWACRLFVAWICLVTINVWLFFYVTH